MPEMWFKSTNACQLHGESFKMEINTKELEAKVLNYFSEKNKWSTPDKVKVTHSISDASASVVISKMYDFVEFDFEFLEMLSKVFETKKINVGDRDSYSGCETCDYGSSYSLTFHAKDIGSHKATKENQVL